MMQHLQKELETCLTALAEPGSGNVLEAVRELDRLQQEHGAALAPELNHYLQRRSYAKALAYVRGDAGITRGSCGR